MKIYDIIIIYVNYYSMEVLCDSLVSIKTALQKVQDLRIRVAAANNSFDEDIANLKNIYPDIDIYNNEANLGFGRAVNRVAEKYNAEFILLINPDALVSENLMEEMYGFMKRNERYAMAYCMIKDMDGRINPASLRNRPEIIPAIFKLTGLSRIFKNSGLFAGFNNCFSGYGESRDVDTCSGSCLMIRKGFFDEAGGFDEDYFLYGEDLDLAKRARDRGKKIRYIADCHILHRKNHSSRQKWFWPLFYFYFTMLLYISKHTEGPSRYIKLIFGFFFISGIFVVKVISKFIRQTLKC